MGQSHGISDCASWPLDQTLCFTPGRRKEFGRAGPHHVHRSFRAWVSFLKLALSVMVQNNPEVTDRHRNLTAAAFPVISSPLTNNVPQWKDKTRPRLTDFLAWIREDFTPTPRAIDPSGNPSGISSSMEKTSTTERQQLSDLLQRGFFLGDPNRLREGICKICYAMEEVKAKVVWNICVDPRWTLSPLRFSLALDWF